MIWKSFREGIKAQTSLFFDWWYIDNVGGLITGCSCDVNGAFCVDENFIVLYEMAFVDFGEDVSDYWIILTGHIMVVSYVFVE